MPYMKADGPAIYRALYELEKSDAVEACWDTTNQGAARKCYTIKAKGRELLKEFKTAFYIEKSVSKEAISLIVANAD